MRRKTRGRVVSALVGISILCGPFVVCAAAVPSVAGSNSNIFCRDQLSAANREALAEKLRRITGLPVEFSDDGALRTGSVVANGGSPTARQLVLKALAGPKVIAIESANDREDVAFARVVPGRWKLPASEGPPAFVVLIDFQDFDYLMGDEAALRSFDVGWAFLHELDHVVNDSSDAAGMNEAGDCEAHINLMRRECHLPVRADYFFTYFPAAEHSAFRTRLVRLAFDATDSSTKKHRRYWVMWDGALVGGLKTDLANAR